MTGLEAALPTGIQRVVWATKVRVCVHDLFRHAVLDDLAVFSRSRYGCRASGFIQVVADEHVVCWLILQALAGSAGRGPKGSSISLGYRHPRQNLGEPTRMPEQSGFCAAIVKSI